MMGTSKGSSCSICDIAACSAARSGEPGAYAFCKISQTRLFVGICRLRKSTMGSFSMVGTLNAASCADMVVETVGSSGCKFRPFKRR
jgi:hypothetical protein